MAAAAARKRPDALNINMGERRLALVDDRWHELRYSNRTAAIHALIDLGIAVTEPALVARLDAYAARHGLSREAALHALLDYALAADPAPAPQP